MSFGWVNAKAGVPGAGGHGAAVMRGAMVSKVRGGEARKPWCAIDRPGRRSWVKIMQSFWRRLHELLS